jgi:hypothetical protein
VSGEIVSNYLASMWFKAALVVLVLSAAYGIILYFMMSKRKLVSMTAEQKIKIAQMLPRVIRVFKIMLWTLPVYVFLLPPIYRLNAQTCYALITGLIMIYAASLSGLLISVRILKLESEQA